jgi:hypothetical protein
MSLTIRLRTLGGMSTSADIVEWILAENGVFQTELEEDPRLKIQKMKIKRTGGGAIRFGGSGRRRDDDDDDDDHESD